MRVDWAIAPIALRASTTRWKTFLAMPRRVYLIDHLIRAWTVSLPSVWDDIAETCRILQRDGDKNWRRLCASFRMRPGHLSMASSLP